MQSDVTDLDLEAKLEDGRGTDFSHGRRVTGRTTPTRTRKMQVADLTTNHNNLSVDRIHQ